MSFVGFGGFNRANQAAILQQQANDMRQAQSILQTIGYVPQGGVANTHGNIQKAVDFGGAKTFQSFIGLGVDLDGNGKFDAYKDGHLALDLDGNGVYDANDMRDTKNMLELFSGGKTTGFSSGFGGFNQAGQARQQVLKARGKQLDLNQDGVLSSWELTRAGARVLVSPKGKTPEMPLSQRPLPGVNSTAPKPTFYGGYSQQPMNHNAQAAYFYQVLQSFMSMFARPY